MLDEVVGSALTKKCAVQKDDRLVLAFSGGSDSVCLLHILSELAYEVIIAYYNHNLREEVEQEVLFAIDSAKKYGFKYHIGSEDINAIARQLGSGIEETAREYRYQFLLETAYKYQAEAVVVAHHADDQVETIMMNLIRGSGLNGLTGMKYRSYLSVDGDVPIIRPMLGIWKNEILDYCKGQNLGFQEDHTNWDITYTRNNLRQQIIPEIEKINPGFKKNLLRTRTILKDDELALQDMVDQQFDRICNTEKNNVLKIDIPAFEHIPPGLQRRIVRRGLETVFNMVKDVSFLMVADICRVINSEDGCKFAQINDQLRVRVEEGIAYIYSADEDLIELDALLLEGDIAHIPVIFPGKTSINQYWSLDAILVTSAELQADYQSPDAYCAFFDVEALHEPIFIRRRANGDRFAPLGMGGKSMKLSDFWINKKLPRRYRKDWPLVCDQKNILWIPGFQPSANAVISSKTDRILKLQFNKENH